MPDLTPAQVTEMEELAALAAEELHPELVPYLEEGAWGPMLRHPLVYSVPLSLPGMANKTLAYKRKALAEAIEAEDWHRAVFLHERPHRIDAFLRYCTYWDETEGPACPHVSEPDLWALAADVWVDSENISQEITKWRGLFDGEPDLWLGEPEERAAFNALPDPIPAFRGGSVGDWSWTTDESIARFFGKRANLPIRRALIPKVDCFGYLTRRGESELLVKMTSEREPLVYPNGVP